MADGTSGSSRNAITKVTDCPGVEHVEAETDDYLITAVEAQVAADHPEMVGKYSREDILSMAHDD